MDVRLARDADGVDWAAHKADLAADDFDNGRTPEQYRVSYTAPGVLLCLAWSGSSVVGTARLLTDGVCNAWLVDVWTQSAYRRQGIGSAMVRDLLERAPGQHVALFTEHHRAFYASLGFGLEVDGMSQVVGRWLES